jgi:ACS family hexuronate transporter-like MFS transporter
MRLDSKPWFFIALVTVAIGISYFDRQALPVAISAIQRNIPIGGAIFNLAAGQLLTYGACYGTLFAVVGSLRATAFAILLSTSGVLYAPGTNIFHQRENLVSS